jgi:iron complex transport system permease protein
MGTMEQVHEIVFWFFGSLSKAGWPEIALTAIMILLPFPVLLRRAWDLNLLSSGDESALALGVNVNRLRMGAVVMASLVTAGGICFTGVIGFVGLVAPHITRMVIGSDHQFLLPASGLVGALIVVAADTIGRTLWAPQVIPIGIVTSFIGVPFFFYLLLKRSREYW